MSSDQEGEDTPPPSAAPAPSNAAPTPPTLAAAAPSGSLLASGSLAAALGKFRFDFSRFFYLKVFYNKYYNCFSLFINLFQFICYLYQRFMNNLVSILKLYFSTIKTFK